MNPIIEAIQNNEMDNLRALITQLSFNARNSSIDNDGNTYLGFAASLPDVNPEVIEILLENGVDIDVRNKNSETPLILACKTGSVESVEVLVTYIEEKIVFKRSSLHAQDASNYSAFHWACSVESLEKVKLLLTSNTYSDIAFWQVLHNDYFFSGIKIVVAKKNEILTRLLLAYNPQATRQALKDFPIQWCDFFMTHDSLEGMKYLCEILSAPHQNWKQLVLCKAILKGSIPIAEALLRHGANGDVSPQLTSLTPLAMAVQTGNVPMTRLLLEHGANVNKSDFYWNSSNQKNTSYTPLSQAMHTPNLYMVSLLLEFGASVQFKESTTSNTLLMMLDMKHPDSKDVLALLISKDDSLIQALNNDGADIFSFSLAKYDQTKILTLLELNIMPNRTYGKSGDDFLMLATEKGAYKVVESVAEKHPEMLERKNSQGKNALLIALECEQLQIADYLAYKGLRCDDMIRDKNNQEVSPLHYFMKKRKIKAAEFLLRYGMSLEEKDKNGKTPLAYANKKVKRQLKVVATEVLLNSHLPENQRYISRSILRQITGANINVFLSSDSPINASRKGKEPALQSSLLTMLDYFSSRCEKTNKLNQNEIFCLEVILEDYSRGFYGESTILSDATKKCILGFEPFSLPVMVSNDIISHRTQEDYIAEVNVLETIAEKLPLSEHTKRIALGVLLPGMRALIVDQEKIIDHMLMQPWELYMLNEKLPLHTNHESHYTKEKAQALIERILDNILGAARLCGEKNLMTEFFNKWTSDGYCLEGRSRALLEWVGEEVMPKEVLKNIHDLMSQYLQHEFYPYAKLMSSFDSSIDLHVITDFIAKRHEGTPCQRDEKFAPKGRVERKYIEQYLLEGLLVEEEDNAKHPGIERLLKICR